MRIFLLNSLGGEEVADHDSRGLSINRLLSFAHPSQMAAMQIDADGRVGEHPAGINQLFVVVSGAGWASGGDGARQPIKPGMAVFWEEGENHQVGSKDGMTALMIESDGLTLAALP